MSQNEQLSQERGIHIPRHQPHHRDEDFDEQTFAVLLQMQREHFWYRGRHKLLLRVVKKEIARRFRAAGDLRAIDLGGGCGGWIEYLQTHTGCEFGQIALGDSSLEALSLAEAVIGPLAARYQVDLLTLPWSEEWDVVFLLDVLEHIADQETVLREVRRSLRPGGLLFVIAPALKFFWTYNDKLVHHQRRYCRKDFEVLAGRAGLELMRTEYFMFFLSPLLLLSRLLLRPPPLTTPEQRRKHMARTHRVPYAPANRLLASIFSMEASMIDAVHFPWGTSILAVFRR
jgi:SAM-dependent methyltransferase